MDSVLRTRRSANFTAVNNDFIRDEKLSWKAKGIIIYVMSLPENWQLHLSELAKHAKDGRDATYNGIRELIENGYCVRREVRDSRGMFAGYEYMISDIKEFLPQTENPETDYPETENPYTENPTLINTNKKETLSLTDNNKAADGGLFPDQQKKRKTAENASCLFANSRYSNFEDFAECFNKPEFANIDIAYYFNAVADWSAQKGKKMKDWIATARNFMRSDMEKGKLHTINKGGFDYESAKAYLDV